MWGLLEGISLEPELAAQDLPRRMLGPEDGQKGGEAGGLGVCGGGLVVVGRNGPSSFFPHPLAFLNMLHGWGLEGSVLSTGEE